MLSRIVAAAVTQFWEQKSWKNFCQRAKWNDVTPLSAPSNWFCRDWMNLVTILRGTTKGQSKYVHQFIMDADSSRCGLDSFWHFGTVFLSLCPLVCAVLIILVLLRTHCTNFTICWKVQRGMRQICNGSLQRAFDTRFNSVTQKHFTQRKFPV